MLDIRRFDIYRKIPKDLTQPTTAGAVISVICIVFITFMVFNDVLAYIFIDVWVHICSYIAILHPTSSVYFHYLYCPLQHYSITNSVQRAKLYDIEPTKLMEILALTFKTKTDVMKSVLLTKLRKFLCIIRMSKFEINKVPGNFHISTHSVTYQPKSHDMRHEINSIIFGDDVTVSLLSLNYLNLQFLNELTF
uniref:ERGIC_N domain-containing protein n=1 Tax=Heterorhabditis bacteriophora TaxID=37862 RepID=A0A1I7WA17_HETBA